MRTLALLAAMTFVAAAQDQPKRPAFEVASIRPVDALSDKPSPGIEITGRAITMHRMSLAGLLRAAYSLQVRFLKAPDWIESEPLYNVAALIPDGSPPSLIPTMIQSMLIDRFHLEYHLETQERNVLALLLDGASPQFPHSANIDESLPGGAYSGIFTVSTQNGAPTWTSPSGTSYRVTMAADGGAQLKLTGASMSELAFHLNTLQDLDVVDRTQLPGKYDFEWSANPEEVCELCPITPTPSMKIATPSTRDSLRKLGLKLEKRKSEVTVFVVDRLEKEPTEN